MGPPLLLDKSGIQFLPKKLLPILYRHYLLVVPPVLVMEILGDLPKEKQGGQEWVRILAEKVGTTNPFINIDHRELRVASLLGRPITMDGRPVIASKEFETTTGKSALITETKEHSQLMRWRFETPSTLDEQSAKEWRQAIRSVDLEKAKPRLKLLNPDYPRVESFAEVGSTVDLMLELGDQSILLEMCLEDAQVDEVSRKAICSRWAQAQSPTLKSFAPYAFFCFRIRMLFHIGLFNNLVTTRNSNTVDLVYLYYTPFCNVFSSNDRLQENLAPLVLRSDQVFVRTSSLRTDFEGIDLFWEHLSNDQKRMWLDRFGYWPPTNHDSFTYKIWTQKMVLPKGVRRGNVLRNLSPEAKEKMNKHVQEAMQQFNHIQEQLNNRKK